MMLTEGSPDALLLTELLTESARGPFGISPDLFSGHRSSHRSRVLEHVSSGGHEGLSLVVQVLRCRPHLRPVRKKDLAHVADEIKAASAITQKIGLIGPSLSDYPHAEDVLRMEGVDFRSPR